MVLRLILNTFISTPTPGLFYTEASISKISDLLETILCNERPYLNRSTYEGSDSSTKPTHPLLVRLESIEDAIRTRNEIAKAALPRSVVENGHVMSIPAFEAHRAALLGHTVALTSNLIAQHQNYDAGTIAQIIPVIFKALDEASR